MVSYRCSQCVHRTHDKLACNWSVEVSGELSTATSFTKEGMSDFRL